MHSQLIDNNGSGSIEYTEFAEVMNNDAADVQFSDNPADPVPWGLHVHQSNVKERSKRRDDRGSIEHLFKWHVLKQSFVQHSRDHSPTT